MAKQSDLFAAGVAEASPRGLSRPPEADSELRRRLIAHGPDSLDDGETLQLILGRCVPAGSDPARAANALMARFGGIGRIIGAAQADLARTVGVEVAEELGLLHTLLTRALAAPLRRREALSSSAAVRTYLRARLAGLPREVFRVLFLDKKNQLIADELMGVGTIDTAPVYPREVVRRALELSAAALVLVHNHPSGDPNPSRADIEITKKVVEAARALDIAVQDHLIVAGDQVTSLLALGLM